MITVWAPEAKEVVIVTKDGEDHMTRSGGGYWVYLNDRLSHGDDYAFRLDGSDPLPDPRSLRQPYGVHGFSQVYDHSIFNWTDTGNQQVPLANALIYELHAGTFSEDGTFQGIIDHLDHLAKLGVTHIELMPVNSFSGARGWGYDGVGLYAPHETYGGPERLKQLVNECHRRGFSVILDVVYNHLGPEGNYLGSYGPYFSDKYHTTWGKAVNFDEKGSTEVRRFFIENALMWLRDYHIDALRLDAIHAIYDMSATHFLEELATAVNTLQGETGRHLALIAESDLNDPRVVRSQEAGGYGIDAQWSDDFHHSVHSLLTGERKGYYSDFGGYDAVAKVFTNPFVYDGIVSPFRGRVHGRNPGSLSGDHFLSYIQNHDQVGNRATGDRLSFLISEGKQKIAAALLFFSPYVPMIFQGEEWGTKSPFQYFTDHGEPELAEAVRRGRKNEFSEFGWKPEEVPDPQSEATFLRSKLNWGELHEESHKKLLKWYESLSALRNNEPTLKNARRTEVTVLTEPQEEWIALVRGNLVLLANIGKNSLLFEIDRFVPDTAGGKITSLLQSDPGIQITPSYLSLPGETVVIFKSRLGTEP